MYSMLDIVHENKKVMLLIGKDEDIDYPDDTDYFVVNEFKDY
jgi:hypothetical protein